MFASEAQLSRERVIQTVDSVVQGGDGRNLIPGFHQLPVRPVTQNGKHTSAAAVATEASFVNASGKIVVSRLLFIVMNSCLCIRRWGYETL